MTATAPIQSRLPLRTDIRQPLLSIQSALLLLVERPRLGSGVLPLTQ